jgi:hypothetical protein
MRRFTTAAVGYLRYSTASGWLHEIMRVHRRETRAAGQYVNVVAGQQHNFAGAYLDGAVAFNRKQKPAGDDEVIGDQERGRRQERSEVVCRKLGDHAPGCREMRVKENASCQPKRPQHVRKRIHHCGLPRLDERSTIPAGRSFAPAVARSIDRPTNTAVNRPPFARFSTPGRLWAHAFSER